MADGFGNVDQQKLSDIVKGLHGRLRKQLREGKNCMGNPKTRNAEFGKQNPKDQNITLHSLFLYR